jgi:hypothetical protein
MSGDIKPNPFANANKALANMGASIKKALDWAGIINDPEFAQLCELVKANWENFAKIITLAGSLWSKYFSPKQG